MPTRLGAAAWLELQPKDKATSPVAFPTPWEPHLQELNLHWSNTMGTQALSKIIWAFDPLEKNINTIRVVAKTLKAITSRWRAQIQPVYVLSAGQFNIIAENWNDWDTRYRRLAQWKIDSVWGLATFEGVLSPKIITENSQSLRQAVRTMLKCAREESADLIVTATHSRRGLQRMFLGSFAETLLLQSEIPILTVNPSTKPLTSIDTIFFPTTLTDRDHNELDIVTRLANTLSADLELYHKYPMLFKPGEIDEPESYAEFEKKTLTATNKKARDWIQQAKRTGVRARIITDTDHGPLPEAIVAHAKTPSSQIIAMFSELGAVASTILGSNTRQVIRTARCPVWVLHKKRAAASLRRTALKAA